MRLSQPILLSAVFPPSLVSPPAHRDDVDLPSQIPVVDTPVNTSQLSLGLPALAGTNGKPKNNKGAMIDEIRYIDYRYYRFLLHPEGEFRMVRCVSHLYASPRDRWTDPLSIVVNGKIPLGKR